MIIELTIIIILALIISNVWLWNNFIHLRELVYMLPTKDEIIKDIISTRVPVTMGPNGVPMVTPKNNPLAG